MARPLSKHKQDGNRYIRPPNIEKTIDAALAQDLASLCRRTSIKNRRSPEFLPSECLVHLIREARRRNDDATMNTMIPPLLQRCEANLLSKVSDKIPNVVYVRDEILGQFGELFATDGIGDNPDELDFFEIRFNRAFKLFRIDILRKEKKTQRVRAKSHAPLPDMYENESTSDEEFFVRLSEKFRTPATQESTIALKNLLEAIESLPTDERDAVVLCHLMGYEVESENPNKTTAATLCGVTGRTIRNRLSNAAKILSRFKEDLQ